MLFEMNTSLIEQNEKGVNDPHPPLNTFPIHLASVTFILHDPAFCLNISVII